MSMTETQVLPTHIGLILDGNRRWAQKNNLPTLEGHKRGAEVFKDIALHAFDSGIQYVSAFVFSSENWSRTEEEVGYLMRLVVKAVETYLDEFHQRGIRIVIIGRRDGLRSKVLAAINRTEEKTQHNSKGTLVLCFNHGGRQEIVDACRALVQSGCAVNEIDEDMMTGAMQYPDVPDIDLVIRTSGEQRLSGFMLWRAAYAELLFIPAYWPDYTTQDFDDAVNEYQRRSRRFGC
jgi:undecaprenyl diphosphate synthase